MKYQGDCLNLEAELTDLQGHLQHRGGDAKTLFQGLDVLPLLLSKLHGNVLAWFVLPPLKFKKQKTNQAL